MNLPKFLTFSAPAERALHQLDVYKTPLIPTRLRNRADPDSITAKVLPDMFRSRRSSKLVLMSDDRERSEKKSNKEAVVNDTKPYAGEGGLKKLLSRAKRDAEKEKEKEKSEVAISDKDAMTEGHPRSEQLLPSLVPPAPSVSPAIPSDWFTSGASTPSSGGSSLRVGRQKTSRNHIQRPTARLSKSRFSAVYDEEGEGDDVMEGNDRVKERQMLEEAAKNVPIFKIPDGFSFAKDVSLLSTLLPSVILSFINARHLLLFPILTTLKRRKSHLSSPSHFLSQSHRHLCPHPQLCRHNH